MSGIKLETRRLFQDGPTVFVSVCVHNYGLIGCFDTEKRKPRPLDKLDNLGMEASGEIPPQIYNMYVG